MDETVLIQEEQKDTDLYQVENPADPFGAE